MGTKGIVSSTAGLAILLQRGHRRHDPGLAHADAGRRPRPRRSRSPSRSCSRSACARFMPQVIACPGCGRTTSTFFQEMARDIQAYLRDQMPVWRERAPGRRGAEGGGHGLRGERARARASTPTSGSACRAPSRSRSRRSSSTASCATTLRGDDIVPRFLEILDEYVDRRYPAPGSHGQRRSSGPESGGRRIATAGVPRTVRRPDAALRPQAAGCPVHPLGCILRAELNGRLLTWVTPTFSFERPS